jgi:hypothetical protein
MFKKLANKIKTIAFKAQKLDPNSPIAKAQSKIIDELVDQAEMVADIAVETAEKIATDAKKEVAKAAKKAATPKAKKVGPRPEDEARAATSAAAKKGRPKKSAK